MAELTEKVKDFFTSAKINKSTLMDVLSEFLAVEMGGQKLYEKALDTGFRFRGENQIPRVSSTDDQASEGPH